jgi:hypothetical protein
MSLRVEHPPEYQIQGSPELKGNLPFANSHWQAKNRSQPFVGTHLGTMASSEKSKFSSALFRAQRKSKNLSKLDTATCMGQSICERASMCCSVQKLGSRRNTNLKPAKRTTLSCSQERPGGNGSFNFYPRIFVCKNPGLFFSKKRVSFL